MEKFIVGGVGTLMVGAVAAIWFAVMWCLWSLWCWVLPQVYASGAPGLIAPGFWLFAASWTLVTLLGRAIFGRSSGK